MAHETGAGPDTRDGVTLGVGVMSRVPSAAGKTRLAPHLSSSRLRALREALFVDTLETVAGVSDAAAVVFFTPAGGEVEIRALSPVPLPCVPQAGDDLGERMRAAVDHLLGPLGCEAAVLVGTDSPLLAAEHITEARESLDGFRGVVLGPADDGGYYLIGMRTRHAALFCGVPWGTSSVLTDTLRAADRGGIEARLIRAAYDVDTIEDLRRLEEDLRTAPRHLAPHVRRWLGDG